MATTTDEWAAARSWIGHVETKADFDRRLDRLTLEHPLRGEAVAAAIEESLREQLAVLTLDQPASASVQGISYSNGANILEIRKSLEKFQAISGQGGSLISVTRLVREDRR